VTLIYLIKDNDARGTFTYYKAKYLLISAYFLPKEMETIDKRGACHNPKRQVDIPNSPRRGKPSRRTGRR